jgi:hypothetical protein
MAAKEMKAGIYQSSAAKIEENNRKKAYENNINM